MSTAPMLTERIIFDDRKVNPVTVDFYLPSPDQPRINDTHKTSVQTKKFQEEKG